MTSEKLYNQILQEYSRDVLNATKMTINQYNPSFPVLGDKNDAVSHIAVYNKFKAHYESFKSVSRPVPSIDVAQKIRARYSAPIRDYKRVENEINIKFDKEVHQVEVDQDLRIAKVNEEIADYVKEFDLKMSELIEKHDNVQQYKEEIELIMRTYNIVGSLELDVESMSLGEIMDLMDLCDYTVNSIVMNREGIGKLNQLFYLPATLNHTNKENRIIVTISHLLALLILGYVARPYGMGVIGLLYIINILGNLRNVSSKARMIKMCYAVTSSINFDRYLNADEGYIALKNKLKEVESEDLSNLYSDIEERRLHELKQHKEANDPEPKLEKELADFNANISSVDVALKNLNKDIDADFMLMDNRFVTSMERFEKHFKDIRDASDRLGDIAEETAVLNTNYRVATVPFRDEPLLDFKMEFPLKSTVFLYDNIYESRKNQVEYLKILLANVLLAVKARQLSVTIFDEHNSGREFMDFVKNETTDFIKVETADLPKVLQEHYTNTETEMKKLGSMGIQEFNTEAVRVKKVPVKYRLLVIVSTSVNLKEDVKFKKYIEHSAELGTLVWHLQTTEQQADDTEGKAKLAEYLKDLTVSEEAFTLTTDGKRLVTPGYPAENYKFTRELGRKIVDKFIEELENSKIDVILHEKDYRQKYIPDDKVWSYSTLEGIELRLGLEDGDPTKPGAVVLGDKNVHGLVVGASGAGKSAFIDNLLASLTQMYSPSELELVMVDFKNVEFKKFTDEYTIPHAKINSGTTDGEYALSVFNYLINEMKRRQKICGKYKLQNTHDYNVRVLRGEIKGEYFPRILALIDEFQVMFQDVDDKILMLIEKAITALSKLARAFGCHLLFTSQSMTGTLKQDIMDQFSLRIALRCSSETSSNIIGNPLASTLPKFGFCYSNDTAGERKEATKLWKIPFLPIDDIREYITKLTRMCVERNEPHRHALFYNEDEKHPSSDLERWYKDYEQMGSDNRLVVLGEQTSYSTSPVPVNFRLTRDDGENVIFSGAERESILNMVNTFMYNFENKEDARYIVHSADNDAIKLLGLHDVIEPKYHDFLNTQLPAEEILEALESWIETRKGKDKSKLKPLYFLGIYWDKLIGLGRDEDYDLVDRFMRILQEGPLQDIHIVLFLKETAQYRKFLSVINHKMLSYSAENDSYNLIDSNKANKEDYLNKYSALHLMNSKLSKFKLYQFEMRGQIEARELVL